MWLKSWLGGNGDWLYVTLERPCPKCAPAPPAGHDLDLDYESTEQTLLAFRRVPDSHTETLLGHAKDYYKDVLDVQATLRDKAKVILGATSFTIAVLATASALLKDSLQSLSVFWFVCALLPLIWVVHHFIRALYHALIAITRESILAVSTQEYIEALAAAQGPPAVLRLAAHYRVAATRMHQLLRDRKSELFLAQACFRSGLVLFPFVVFLYLIVTYVAGSASEPKWAAPHIAAISEAKTKLAALDLDLSTLRDSLNRSNAVHDRELADLDKSTVQDAQSLQRLNDRLATVQRDAEQFQRDLDRQAKNQENAASLKEAIKGIEDELARLRGRIDALLSAVKSLKSSETPPKKDEMK